jgi:hypothetical protein
MTEPDVALTDYGLFVECAVFAWLVFRQTAQNTALRAWVVLFFAATALAALCGGTVHGFFTDETAGVGWALWKVAMLSIGGAALAGWAIGGRLLFSRRGADRVLVFAAGLIVAYAAAIVFVNDAFVVAVAGYVPAAALLLAGFIRAAVRGQGGWATPGAWGLALSFAAAAIQQLRVALHPVYFNHNALYHVVQAVALALLFAACRGLLNMRGDLHADTA